MECEDSEDSDDGDNISLSDFETSSDGSIYEGEDDYDDYDPEGVESDDDKQNCCHWSTKKDDESETDHFENENMVDFGCPALNFDDDTKPNDIVERIIDERFMLMCIDATNEHGQSDPKYLEKIGEIPLEEKGIWFVRGFLAVKWHLRLIRYPQLKWAWSDDPLRSQPQVKKIMPLEVFQLMLKHFRVVLPSSLPPKENASYHPLQNINNGVNYLREKAVSLWKTGKTLCIDEGRIVSKSRRNPYKIRNPDKPIRMGWTVCKVSNKGQHGCYFINNHVTKVGKKSYVHPENGKNYDIVDQLIVGLKDESRLVVMDNGFPTVKLLKDARELWKTKVIATQRGNTAHLPKSHKTNVKKTKEFVRGFSKSLHCGNLSITYWNDNNAVTFLDNGVPSGREHWETIEVNQGAKKAVIHVPHVAKVYKEVYGWVDRSNQQLAYYNSEVRSIRKQSRVLDCLLEMYVLVNAHTIWRNSPNLLEGLSRDKMAQSEFRFEIIRVWYTMFRKTNGSKEVLHYGISRQPNHRRKLAHTITSPRKGCHDTERISTDETTCKSQRLRCRICKRKSSYKCRKCSSRGEPLVLCSAKTGRQCWNEYHVTREYDLPSSQSQSQE